MIVVEPFAGCGSPSGAESPSVAGTEASLVTGADSVSVPSGDTSPIISGSGDVIAPDEPLAAIGSGGSYATAAARALMENTELSAREIAEKAMKIAGEICIYTNDRITVEELQG